MHKEFIVSTQDKYQLVDITEDVKLFLKETRIEQGICHVYVPHATCGIIINENYDPNICDDFTDALNKMIKEGVWRHDTVDNNAAAHIKSSIVGPSETIPVKDNELQLGTWQNIMVCDFDGPKNKRRIIINIIKGDDNAM